MAEALNSVTRLFQGQMQDGTVVTYKAIWQGYRDMAWNESGGPSTLTHPVDNRQCHWTVSGWITRRVAVEIAGQEYFNDNIQRVFNQNKVNQGSDFQVLRLRSENCNDCADRRNSDFDDMANNVNGAIQGTADSDLQSVLADIQGLPGMVQVNLQP